MQAIYTRANSYESLDDAKADLKYGLGFFVIPMDCRDRLPVMNQDFYDHSAEIH